MPLFLLGVLLGGISAGVTHHQTGSTQLAVIVGVIASIATWLGLATVIFADD
ncbi:hypothetical protein [Streptomyces sp. NPDC057249]|uniref:hypothetical protein n=1 Tax=Streptomyces sp. NPDC057249 TaxID=3346067 RepID=UPI00362E2B58